MEKFANGPAFSGGGWREEDLRAPRRTEKCPAIKTHAEHELLLQMGGCVSYDAGD